MNMGKGVVTSRQESEIPGRRNSKSIFGEQKENREWSLVS